MYSSKQVNNDKTNVIYEKKRKEWKETRKTERAN